MTSQLSALAGGLSLKKAKSYYLDFDLNSIMKIIEVAKHL